MFHDINFEKLQLLSCQVPLFRSALIIALTFLISTHPIKIEARQNDVSGQSMCSTPSLRELSPLAQAVIDNIFATPGAANNSSVSSTLILTQCNKFHQVLVDGPEIYEAARDIIARAEYEVDMAFYQWDETSYAVTAIGAGLIMAQAHHSPQYPLLVRIVIDDVDNRLDPDRVINRLWNSQKRWESMGLDSSRVIMQFATDARPTPVAANLHDKFIIVDGRFLMVTGANPQVFHNPPTPWHDTGYIFEGDIARSALSSFDDTWLTDSIHWDCRQQSGFDCNERSNHHQHPNPTRPRLPIAFPAGTISILAVAREEGRTSPPQNDTDNPQDIAWLTVMDNAQRHIRVETPNINDDAFRTSVLEAVGRGVNVQLIASVGFNFGASNLPFQGGDNQDVVADIRKKIWDNFPQNLDLFEVRWYSQDGIEPVEGNGPGANHTKYMTVDYQIAIVGSGNMDTPSWNFSQEFNVLIDDANITRELDYNVFFPDWASSIGQYIELYEGHNGMQDIVCPISVVEDKLVSFEETRFCDNDKAESILINDTPAGRVFRFFDTGFRRDDDWTEVVIKSYIDSRYVPSLETSFEDEFIRMTYHRNNDLDGKVSSLVVASRSVGSTVDLYEGNNAEKNLVCSLQVGRPYTYRFPNHAQCNNDEAKSLRLWDVSEGLILRLYDKSDGREIGDWVEIEVKRKLRSKVIGTFERSFEDQDVRVTYHNFGDDLDGKVSRLEIDSTDS